MPVLFPAYAMLLEDRTLPQHNQIEIWLLSTDCLTDVHREQWRTLLSHAELALAERILAPREKDLFIGARALLRTLLSRATGLPENAWRFGTGTYGRPYISGPQQYRHVHFNISHTSGLIACALSSAFTVGVDVENTEQERDFRSMARHFFAPAEIAALETLDDEQLCEKFHIYWTLKEAYLKATGAGMSRSTASFWFELTQPPRLYPANQADDDDAGCWRFFSETVGARHQLALAVKVELALAVDVQMYSLAPSMQTAEDMGLFTLVPASNDQGQSLNTTSAFHIPKSSCDFCKS